MVRRTGVGHEGLYGSVQLRQQHRLHLLANHRILDRDKGCAAEPGVVARATHLVFLGVGIQAWIGDRRIWLPGKVVILDAVKGVPEIVACFLREVGARRGGVGFRHRVGAGAFGYRFGAREAGADEERPLAMAGGERKVRGEAAVGGAHRHVYVLDRFQAEEGVWRLYQLPGIFAGKIGDVIPTFGRGVDDTQQIAGGIGTVKAREMHPLTGVGRPWR
ncbi:MAG: hypothetical protein BWY76_02257 [bacterium ADurb.Bin429]|nr:MAG: hypothetical protein BWY76_02257 [bacterium ADurb.Bin429]